jgi:hypothetical protein
MAMPMLCFQPWRGKCDYRPPGKATHRTGDLGPAAREARRPYRIVIRGGSAGGYTTLAALTFRNFFQGGASYYGISPKPLSFDSDSPASGLHKSVQTVANNGTTSPLRWQNDDRIRWCNRH